MRRRTTSEISSLTVISFKQKEFLCQVTVRARSKEKHKVHTTWYNKTSF